MAESSKSGFMGMNTITTLAIVGVGVYAYMQCKKKQK